MKNKLFMVVAGTIALVGLMMALFNTNDEAQAGNTIEPTPTHITQTIQATDLFASLSVSGGTAVGSDNTITIRAINMGAIDANVIMTLTLSDGLHYKGATYTLTQTQVSVNQQVVIINTQLRGGINNITETMFAPNAETVTTCVYLKSVGPQTITLQLSDQSGQAHNFTHTMTITNMYLFIPLIASHKIQVISMTVPIETRFIRSDARSWEQAYQGNFLHPEPYNGFGVVLEASYRWGYALGRSYISAEIPVITAPVRLAVLSFSPCVLLLRMPPNDVSVHIGTWDGQIPTDNAMLWSAYGPPVMTFTLNITNTDCEREIPAEVQIRLPSNLIVSGQTLRLVFRDPLDSKDLNTDPIYRAWLEQGLIVGRQWYRHHNSTPRFQLTISEAELCDPPSQCCDGYCLKSQK